MKTRLSAYKPWWPAIPSRNKDLKFNSIRNYQFSVHSIFNQQIFKRIHRISWPSCGHKYQRQTTNIPSIIHILYRGQEYHVPWQGTATSMITLLHYREISIVYTACVPHRWIASVSLNSFCYTWQGIWPYTANNYYISWRRLTSSFNMAYSL